MDDHAPTQPLFLPTPARLPGQVRRLGRFLALGTAGLVALLAGLAWDAVLHARGPGLTAREGVSTLSNPDHLLAGAGVALVAAGLLGALATLATVRRRAPLPAGARAGLGVLAAVLVLGAGVTGAWAAAGHGHDGGGAAAAHGQPGQAVAASSGPDGRADHAGAHAIANLPDVAAASDAERARAHALLDASVAATRRYRDPEAARAAGYRFALGGQGRLLHAPNPAYRDDGRLLDPDRPEALVYWRGPRGGLALVGVMFTAPEGAPGPDVGGPITRWHDHETCRDPATGAKAGRPAQGACPAGRVLHRSGELLHVWFTSDLATAFALRPPAAALASSLAVAAPSA